MTVFFGWRLCKSHSYLRAKGRKWFINFERMVSCCSKFGETLYFKPRPNQSVATKICPDMVPFYGTSIPCEDIDMSKSTLVTIASLGALSSNAPRIISIIDLLIHSVNSRRDLSNLYIQNDYVRSFSHSNLSFPVSHSHLHSLLSLTWGFLFC